MSRIGKKPITIPKGVTVKVLAGAVEVQGPKGKMRQAHPAGVNFELADGHLHAKVGEDPELGKFHGLARSLVANAVQGVTDGFKKELDIVGVGYRAEVKGKQVVFALGYSHPVVFDIPEGIAVAIDKQTHITVTEVALAIGALYTSEARWPEVVAHHTQLLRRHRAVASADQLARAELAIGRALARSGDRTRAEPHLRAAVATYESAAPADEVARARLHDAVSEALFELAEAERERFEAIAFPTLRGPASLARVDRWAAEELMPWMEAKRLAFVAAEEAYGRVHPLAVPRWRIASAARIGDMVAGMVERVRGAPVPEVIARDPELLDAYWEALDRATDPYLAIAEQRYAYCLNTATETRFFDDRSRHCEEQLNRLDTARFPIAAELRGEPDYRPDEGAPPTAPSLSDSRDG